MKFIGKTKLLIINNLMLKNMKKPGNMLNAMKTLPCLIFLFFISSCISTDSDIFYINPLSIKENKIYLSQIADDVTYIPIDNAIPLGLIFSAKLTKDNIFLSVKDIGLLAYNRKGKFLHNVGSIGRGPGEYIYGLSYAIGDDNKVYLIDNGNEILIYNSNGKYIKSIYLNTLNAYFNKIEFNNNMLFLIQSSSGGQLKYDWVILDTLGKIVEQKKTSIPYFQTNLGGFEGIYKCGNVISCWNCYNDTVYSIYPAFIYKPTILFAQGDFRWPKSNLTDLTKLGLYMQPHLLFETKNYIVFRYFYDSKQNLTIIDKTSREAYLTYLVTDPNSNNRKGGIINDIDGGIKFNPIAYFEENNHEYLIGLQNSYEFRLHVIGNEIKEPQPKYVEKEFSFETLSKSLQETDNPVLVLVHLKK